MSTEGRISSIGHSAKKAICCTLTCGVTFFVTRHFYVDDYRDDFGSAMQRAQHAALLNAAIASLIWQIQTDIRSKGPAFGAVLAGGVSGSVSYFAMALEVAVLLLHPHDICLQDLWEARLLGFMINWALMSIGVGLFTSIAYALLRTLWHKSIN